MTISNTIGTAPGYILESGCIHVVLPGTREMKLMFNNAVLPCYLIKCPNATYRKSSFRLIVVVSLRLQMH